MNPGLWPCLRPGPSEGASRGWLGGRTGRLILGVYGGRLRLCLPSRQRPRLGGKRAPASARGKAGGEPAEQERGLGRGKRAEGWGSEGRGTAQAGVGQPWGTGAPARAVRGTWVGWRGQAPGGSSGCEGSPWLRGGRVAALQAGAPARRAGVGAPGWGGPTAGRGAGLTIQALHGQHVVPAEQRVAAQPLVVGRHERARRRRVRQAERVADLVRQHHEQVAPAAAAQRPALVAVEVRFAPAGQEGVRQGAPCRRRGGSGGATARLVSPRVPTLQRGAPGLGVVVFCGTVFLLMTSGRG